MRELSLFTGAGGGLLGTKLLGWKAVGYVEFNGFCQRLIAQRIKDGILDEAPIFGDVRAFIREGYAAAYTGMVDVITAGFPCQPFSVAGRGLGEADARNMWPETIDCIRIIRPRFGLLENVPGLLAHPYMGKVFGDLAAAGYDYKWLCLSAESQGAPIERERLFIAISDSSHGKTGMGDFENGARSLREGTNRECYEFWLQAPPRSTRVVNGLASYLDRVGAIGNGQVPVVVKTVWRLLSE